MSYKHACTKCHTPYQDEDPDPYLCIPCLAERKAIAKELDAKFAGRSTEKVPSELELFDAQAKTMPSQHGGTASFIRMKI